MKKNISTKRTSTVNTINTLQRFTSRTISGIINVIGFFSTLKAKFITLSTTLNVQSTNSKFTTKTFVLMNKSVFQHCKKG